jgi:iron complex outermembrane receptor protein
MNARSRRGRLAAGLIASCLSGWAGAQVEAGDDIDSTAYSYPVVITPTRLKQSLADVPASVTVITGETLRRYGITTIPDALRLVPGMAVSRSLGSDYRVNYHGTSIVAPRRMNVLIDGYSVYGSGLSRVDWAMLPVALEDIDRIEVTRGPDSSSYGPNSMMSVINILTRRPKDVESALASLAVGSQSSVDALLRGATQLGEATHVAVTAQTERNSGYDASNLKWGQHDSIRMRRLNLRSQTDIDNWTTLELQLSHQDTDRQEAYSGDPFITSYPDLNRRDTQVNAKWTHAFSSRHEVQIKALAQSAGTRQAYASCWPRFALHPSILAITRAHPELGAAIGNGADVLTLLTTYPLTPDEYASLAAAIATMGGPQGALQTLCGTSNMNYDESRTQLELQDTFVVSDTLRFVGGAGMRWQQADSQSLLGGQVSNAVRWLFGHGEYRATPALTFNAGGYAEDNSLGNRSFSPRLAANWRLSDEQTLRAVYSQGTRTPDLLEKRGNWRPVLEDFSPAFLGQTSGSTVTVFKGAPDLEEERIRSLELGYLLAVRRWGLVMDTRLFDDRLTNLISNFTTSTQLNPSNKSSTRLAGAETQLNWELSSDWSGWLTYSYLVNFEASNTMEQTQWSRHSGAVGLSHAFNDAWRASLSTYQSSGNGLGESHYSRTDLSLIHSFAWAAQNASASLTLSYLDTPTASTYLKSIGALRASFNQQLGVYAKLRVAF